MKGKGHWSPDEQRRLLLDSIAGYAIFMLGPDGRIESWNRGGERLFGYADAEVIGRPVSILFAEEQRDRCAAELLRARETGRTEDEGWRVRKDGTRFWASAAITAIRDDEGELIGFAQITRDLTERRSSEEQMRLGEERFRLLVESVRDYAIFMLDPEGRVATWNTGRRAHQGLRAPSEIIGQHFS